MIAYVSCKYMIFELYLFSYANLPLRVAVVQLKTEKHKLHKTQVLR